MPPFARAPLFLLSILCLALFAPGLASVPPLDRDESRFAQASKQMVETGDYVRIRFQDKARNKKPAGAYWAQAASAQVFLDDDLAHIWAYRVPSALAAWLGVLLIFALARRCMGETPGFMAAALCACSLLLVLEAHQAKADALLFLCVTAAQAALGMIYIRARETPEDIAPPGAQTGAQTGAPPGAGGAGGAALAYGFWAAEGAAILVKGPIGPMIAALTVIALAAADKDRRWLLRLRPVTGIALMAAVAAPWFIAVTMAEGRAFWVESVGGDLLAKAAGGQESHGAPPGYHTLLVHVMLWPAAVLLWPALLHAWRRRAEPWVRFALAWVLPAWLVFELVPTKLPHYVLPLYPALALLIADFAADWAGGAARLGRAGLAGCVVTAALFPAALAGAGLYAPAYLQSPAAWMYAALLAGCAAAALIMTVPAFMQGRASEGLRAGVFSAVMLFAVVFAGVLPRLDGMWLSRAAADAVSEHSGPAARGAPSAPAAAAGFHEPSLVFLMGTDTRLTTGADAAEILDRGGCAVVTAEENPAFRAAAAEKGRPFETAAEITGVNYSRGRAKRIHVHCAGLGAVK